MEKERSYRLSGGMFEREAEIESVKRIFFLSVEGRSSEPSYFKNLNRWLHAHGNRSVVLHVLKHPNDGLSSVESVLELLEECKALREGEALIPLSILEKIKDTFSDQEIASILNGDNEVEKKRRCEFYSMMLGFGINLDYRQYLQSVSAEDGDRFVVVLDRDQSSHERSSLELLGQKCRDKGYVYCLSNPCFEFWLLLHLVDQSTLCSEDVMNQLLENKKKSNKHTFVSKWVSDLARHAKRIPLTAFDELYAPNTEKAMAASRRFASDDVTVLDNVGTTMPRLLGELINP